MSNIKATTSSVAAATPPLTYSIDPYLYNNGFGNHVASEALPGALPIGQNTPQVAPYHLYTEQISGTPFTAPRATNQFSWVYRIMPGAAHTAFQPVPENETPSHLCASFFHNDQLVNTPTQLRWSPFDITASPTLILQKGTTQAGSSVATTDGTTFIQGWKTLAGAGDPSLKQGLAIHIYTATASMIRSAFYNSDGDILIVPQQGRLDITTEFGKIMVHPNEICVVQRGIRFSVGLPDGPSRGYILEVYGGHFEIPDLGPIGANGLANPLHFQTPVAYFEDIDAEYKIYTKYNGEHFVARQNHSPFDVVAFKGNYMPYKYNLEKFNVINSVSFDHLDPSIFTVLTCKTAVPGTPLADFVIFPPRWAVAEHTFRPPYFHRNNASEMMGLIKGAYEAKSHGFLPGGATLHSTFTPHGPDAAAFDKATADALQPVRIAEGTMAFMFESSLMLKVTRWAFTCPQLQLDYNETSWMPLKKQFTPKEK